MEVLLGIILFFVLLWYGFRVFLKYIFPWLLARFVRRQQSRFNNFNQQSNPGNQQPDGEVRIKDKQGKKPKSDDGFGEYVDFEDVKE